MRRLLQQATAAAAAGIEAAPVQLLRWRDELNYTIINRGMQQVIATHVTIQRIVTLRIPGTDSSQGTTTGLKLKKPAESQKYVFVNFHSCDDVFNYMESKNPF
jgi:hypothetical protein